MNLNTLLWILQTILCIKFISAAITHAFQQTKPAMQQAIQKMGPSTRFIHPTFSLFMVLFSIGLVLPAIWNSLARLIPLSAAGLAAMNVVSIFLHLKYREKPMLFAGIILFAMSVFIVYARWTFPPL